MNFWRISRRQIVLLLAASVLIPMMLRWFEHSQVYHPDRHLEATGAELGRSFQDVYFSSEGLKLNGWFYPANADSTRSSIVVLICHGNGGNISHRLDITKALLTTGVNVFLFDYRGYGRSEGRPSEEGTYQDGMAACQWLCRKGFAETNIVLFGESLGGGIASELATRIHCAGLILQSTFTSIVDIGAELFPWLPVRWIATIKYNTLSKLPRIKAPVLVMHSRDDRLIGFRHSQRNFAAANEPKLFCELVGEHNDPLTNRGQFIADIETFLQMLATTAKQGAPSRR